MKENMTDQSRPPSSIAPWLSSDTRILVVCADEQLSAGTLFQVCSLFCNKIQQTLYSDTF